MVPAFLCIDVEHDEQTPGIADRPWRGFAATVEIVEKLRSQLAERSGVEPHPTWFFRMDPVIERCFGRLDYAVDRHRDLVELLSIRGDQFGIHVHAHRWDEQRGLYSDYADLAWASACVAVAAETFEGCFGERPKRCRHGGYFMPEPVVDMAVRVGIEVDLTAEPGLAPKTHDPSFGNYATAPSTDFRDYPLHPYRASVADAGRPAAGAHDARPLVMIPLTAYDYGSALSSGPRRLIAKLWPSSPGAALPLNPWKPWPSAARYWDLVARAVDQAPVPCLAIAIRTDMPGSPEAERARRLLEHLPHHPIAKRLEFVDPLPRSAALVAQ